MALRLKTNLIVIHCSATPPSMDIGAKEIDSWHRKEGFLKIGYHFVIRRDGTVEKGREIGEVGAHCNPPLGTNSRSVGICMVGGVSQKDLKVPENNFTEAQWEELPKLIHQVLEKYPNCEILGHRDLAPGRGCPSFNVKPWVAGGMKGCG